MTDKPTDPDLINRECRQAQAEGREISDACARVIASQWHDPAKVHGPAFSTTGAIWAPDSVWWSLFGGTDHNGCSWYDGMTPDDQLAADMLGTYLVRAGKRGPVAGWSRLWVGQS